MPENCEDFAAGRGQDRGGVGFPHFVLPPYSDIAAPRLNLQSLPGMLENHELGQPMLLIIPAATSARIVTTWRDIKNRFREANNTA